jgi:Uma2 family endonuclease
MTIAAFEHGYPWTEEEFLALGETSDRVELFDGSLHVTPAPSVRHQDLSSNLLLALRTAARAAGLSVYLSVNVRLKLDRLAIPDLVIVDPIDTSTLVVDARSVRLICEIVSPSNAAMDRVLKMHYYAEARIPYYLLVEQAPLRVRLFRIEGEHYVLEREAGAGAVLSIDDPIHVEIDPGTLG